MNKTRISKHQERSKIHEIDDLIKKVSLMQYDQQIEHHKSSRKAAKVANKPLQENSIITNTPIDSSIEVVNISNKENTWEIAIDDEKENIFSNPTNSNTQLLCFSSYEEEDPLDMFSQKKLREIREMNEKHLIEMKNFKENCAKLREKTLKNLKRQSETEPLQNLLNGIKKDFN